MGRIDQCQPPEDNVGKSIAVSKRAGLPSKSHLVNSPYVQLCLAVNGGDLLDKANKTIAVNLWAGRS